jgi:hypothetical protein
MTDGFSWRDRLRKWTRWTVPVGKRDIITDTTMPAPAPATAAEAVADDGEIHELKDSNEVITAAKKPESPRPKGYAYWETKYFTHSSCVLGSILHSLPSGSPPITIEQLLAKDAKLSLKVPQTFSTNVPNISRILSGQSALHGVLSDARGKAHQSLILRFHPNPFFKAPESELAVGAEALSTYPTVEMRFAVEPTTGVPTLKDIQAVVLVDNADIMLPDCNVDIRFQQRITSRLVILYHKYPAAISEFLKNANLDMGGQKMKFPPEITLPIAEHLIQNSQSEDKHKTREVEYLYAGLEIRNRITMDYQGWEIHYTSIESGRAGGRRGELRLRPVRTKKGEDEKENPSQCTEEAFVKSAFDIAQTLDDGEGRVQRKVRTMKRTTTILTSKGHLMSAKPSRFFAKRIKVSYHGKDEAAA